MQSRSTRTQEIDREIAIPVDGEDINASLVVPVQARGIVLFAHGSGSSRFSPRNRYVAHYLNQAGLATLLTDLLTSAEEAVDTSTGEFRFDIELLASRLIVAMSYCQDVDELKDLPI